MAKTKFPVEEHEDESSAWQQICTDSITIATQANSPRFQSFTNESENPSSAKLCLLEQKVQETFQTCQTCCFRTLGVNEAQILSLRRLPFLGLVPIKHTFSFKVCKDSSAMLTLLF